MPQMDGITAINKIKEICLAPIVMLSNLTEAGAEITIRALELGADDFFLKSSLVNKNAKKYKGNIIVESESSCIVYGMPKSIYDANLADSKVHLNLIYNEILKFI